MPRGGFFRFEVVVKDDERAFITNNGRFVKLVGPGKYSAFDFEREMAAEVVKVVRAEIPAERALMLQKTHPKLVEQHFQIARTGPTQVGLIFFDGVLSKLMHPNATRVYWKTITQVDVELVETADVLRVSKDHLDRIYFETTAIASTIVEAHEAALLIVDGELRETLAPGRHAFWAIGRTDPPAEDRSAPAAAGGHGAGDPDQGPRGDPRNADRVLQGRRSRCRGDEHQRSGRTRSTGWCSSPSARPWRRGRSTTSSPRATPSTVRSATMSSTASRRSGRRSAKSASRMSSCRATSATCSTRSWRRSGSPRRT